MREVSCRATVALLEALALRDIAPCELVRDLAVRLDDIDDPLRRIDWDAFALLLERAEKLLGGPDALEELGSNHVTSPRLRFFRTIGGLFTSARALYWLGCKWYGPSLFSNILVEYEDLPDGSIRETLEIPEGFRDSPQFFHVMQEALRCTPRALGQPDAFVKMELAPRRAVYTLTPPPSLSLLVRLRRGWRIVFAARGTIEELGLQQEQLKQAYDELSAAHQQIASQAEKVRTISLLGRELAEHIELEGLADALIELLQTRFGCSGIALWLQPRPTAGLQLLRSVGHDSRPPELRYPLRSGEREIGRLDVWLPSQRAAGEHADLIGELLPWIAIALDNARSFAAMRVGKELLEEKVRELESAQRALRQSESQLRHAQKMEAIGQLAGGVAHDFNNTLTAITGYAHLLLDQANGDDSMRRDIREIQYAVEHAEALTRQLLAFSRRQVLQLERLDLNDLVAEMGAMLQRLIGEHIELGTDLAPDLGPVRADRGQLYQVIVNLALNARDAMTPGGGSLTIRTENAELAEDDPERTEDLRPSSYVRLTVTDTGRGMDEATLEHIFEPFFTTKALDKGTGLGLSTVYGIVRQSGGAIRVTSEPGVGSSFLLLFPRLDAGQAARTEHPETSDSLAGSETVLLVEDHAAVRRLARRSLEKHGYKVLEASHGPEALELASRTPQDVQLLVTDVVMPQMSGRELARRLLERRPSLRVLYISGYAKDLSLDGENAEVDGRFLAKPFTPRRLARAVREALDTPRP